MHHYVVSAFALGAFIIFSGCSTESGRRAADVPDSVISFVLGPHHFNAGDSITIEQVTATSPFYEVGDRVMVRGRYELKSHVEAMLALHLNHINFIGMGYQGGPSPGQTMRVGRGSGEFQLECILQGAGALRVSFYANPGDSFGGVYVVPRQLMGKISNEDMMGY